MARPSVSGQTANELAGAVEKGEGGVPTLAGGAPVDETPTERSDDSGPERGTKEVDGCIIVTWEGGANDPTCPFNWTLWKKTWVVGIICFQILWATMLSAIYASATEGIAEELHVSPLVARIPQATYLLGFSVGPVILTPLAEDYGRKWIYTGCIVILYVLQIPCALAHSIATLIVVRFIAGCFASPLLNSVASIPDLFTPDDPLQGYYVQFWAHSAEFIILGTLFGGYINASLGWRWIFWVSAIVGAALAVPYVLLVPETRGGAILAARARKMRRKTGNPKIRALAELHRRTWAQIVQESVIRPVRMLFTEPAVFLFGAYDGLSYALVFVLLEAYPLIYMRHGFSVTQSGLCFLAVYIGFLIGMLCYPLQRMAEIRAVKRNGGKAYPETCLLWCFVAAVMLPVSLWWFAWTLQPSIHWIVSILASVLFGTAGHIIFIASSIYVLMYGDYSSSAVSGQSFLREAMSAGLSIVGATFYENVGYSQATSILAAIATLMMPIPFVFYRYGETIRRRSKFLQELESRPPEH